MTVAVGLLTAIGDIKRFASSEKLVSYFGLSPSVRQSGNGPAHHGRITKQGRSHARGMLARISMDGRGRWMDNVSIERLWRSLKYECVYLHAFETGSELRVGLSRWIGYYNARRPHSLWADTPGEVYWSIRMGKLAA
jgi:transposase InsO family protein